MLRPGRGSGGPPTAGGYGSAGPSPAGRGPPPQSPYGRPPPGGPGGLPPQSPYGRAGGVGGAGLPPPGVYSSPMPPTGTAYSSNYGGYGGSAGAGASSGGGGGSGYSNGGGSSSGTGGSYGGYTGGSSSGGGGGTGSAYGGYSGGASNMSSSSVGNNSLSSKGKKRRSQRTNWMQMATNPLTWTSTLAAIFFILTIRYQFAQSTFLKNADARNLAQALVMIRSARTEQDHLRSELRTLKESYKAAVNTNSQRDGEVQKLRAQIRELSEKSNPHHHAIVQQQEEQLQMHASEKAHMTLREQALKTQVESLKQAASRESSRTVTERFGPGPHYCEFTVDLPNVPEETSLRTFIVEMAPLNAMPHAVHLFMEQVAHGLWDGGWFYINGPHVLQAGPQANEEEMEHGFPEGEDERSSALRPFKAVQLVSLDFPEYSDAFPHLPWTLGFTGRPGGPDFYINKVDNTRAHGPGGQDHHDLSEYADACFAKVVKGFDTLTLMTENEVINDDTDFKFFYEEPVRIDRVVIVPSPFGSNATTTTTSSSSSSSGSGSGSAGQVNVNGEAASGSATDTAAATEQLLKKIEAMRAESDRSFQGGAAAAAANKMHEQLKERSTKETMRDMHHKEESNSKKRAKRMIHRPEIDHMVEP